MTREQQVAEAQRLRAEGLTYGQIGKRFGVTKTTARRWILPKAAERSRQSSRRWKREHRGACVDCGEDNGYLGESERCRSCEAEHRRVWTEELVVQAIRLFADRYGRSPHAADFNPYLVRGRKWRSERFYEDGDYPTQGTVQMVFGSWNAAISAAGFSPVGPGEYERNGRRGAHLEREAA